MTIDDENEVFMQGKQKEFAPRRLAAALLAIAAASLSCVHAQTPPPAVASDKASAHPSELQTMTRPAPASPDGFLPSEPKLVNPLIQKSNAPSGASAQESVEAKHEPHHHVEFENDFIRVLRVAIPPQGATLWHTHAHDFAVIGVEGTTMRGQAAGEAPKDHALTTGAVMFAPYGEKILIHRESNTSANQLNHQAAVEFLYPRPLGFPVSEREGAQWALVIARLRVWRIRLNKGEYTPLVFRGAPALRVVMSGERAMETDSLGRTHDLTLKAGDFFWLGGPAISSIANTSDAQLDIFEMEFK